VLSTFLFCFSLATFSFFDIELSWGLLFVVTFSIASFEMETFSSSLVVFNSFEATIGASLFKVLVSIDD
jgi:hypothetical protein